MSAQPKEDNRAKESALASLNSIVDQVKRLKHVEECDGKNRRKCGLTDAEIYSGINLWYEKGKSPKATKEEREQYHDEEAARQSIQEDPLSVDVRGGWHTPGSQDDTDSYEYIILLGTGGPAVRIYGELGQYNTPENADLQYQDWFTPWETLYVENDEEREALLTYAQQFYFGD